MLVHQDELPVHLDEAGVRMDFASVQLISVFVQFIPEQSVLIPERNGVFPELNVLFLGLNGLIPDQSLLIAAQNGLVPEWSAFIPRQNGLICTQIDVDDSPCHSDTEDDMRRLSLGETLSGSGLMVAGLKVTIDKLKRRGLDEGFVASLEGLNKTIGELNAEQEALKSRLKEKTAPLGIRGNCI